MTPLYGPKESTFRDVDHVLRSACSRFCREVGFKGDLEELYSDATVAFMEAYESYNPDYGTKFESWLTTKVMYRLMQQNRQRQIEWHRLPKEALALIEALPAVDRFRLAYFLDNLSEDAKVMAVSALELFKGARTITAWSRKKLILTLQRSGWPSKRIADSFREIQLALATA